MEFYVIWAKRRGWHKLVSIPNGMEFYGIWRDIYAIPERFQFPTGWNSTSYKKCMQSLQKIVSIPNGMEFYDRKLVIAAFDSEFQFPTGWNSTIGPHKEFLPMGSFNSQRDGILLVLSAMCHHLHAFQFPTGWNSTLLRAQKLVLQKYVSIPNGMEFYQSHRKQRLKAHSFQFPTGWNSTKP